MARYIPIGEPSNHSEVEGIRALRDTLPEHFLVIGNFELHIPNRPNSFEFDAVVVGEYGLYAVEIKGWSGTVQGDTRRWYLEWGRVKNPFILTERKAKALRSFLGQAVDGLPSDVFCQPILMLPDDAEWDIADRREGQIVTPNNLYSSFVDEERMLENGPGPLLEGDLCERIERALVPLATPTQIPRAINDYEIIGVVDSEDKPYVESVARHSLVRTRGRVRMKKYSLDPLATAEEQKREFERVLRDTEALTELAANPYVASAYEVIRDRDDQHNFYLVSEWVGPHTLHDFIQTSSASDDEIHRMRLATHLLKAVQFMHDRGIVHRNLHPGVVYMTPEKSNVPFKIADFDYARIVQLPSIEGSFEQLGTEGYMAPELWQSDEYDHRVDIFSVGAILFELFTGEKFYRELKDALHHGATWQERRELLPTDKCRELLGRLLAEDPADRPSGLDSTIDDLVSTLDSNGASTPV